MPGRLIDAATAGKVELFTSPWLLAELDRVLRRAKFDAIIAAAGISRADFVLGYAALTTIVTPETVPSVIPDDPDDDNVLACATTADADLVVSGDRHLLSIRVFQDRRIVRPAEGMEIVNRFPKD